MPPPAHAACGGDPLADCEEAFKEAVTGLSHSNDTADKPEDANIIGEAIKECLDCALQELIKYEYRRIVSSLTIILSEVFRHLAFFIAIS